jgi:hypothetical protein
MRTNKLYEKVPAVKLGTWILFPVVDAELRARRSDGASEQRSSLYGLLVGEGLGQMGGCSGGPIR